MANFFWGDNGQALSQDELERRQRMADSLLSGQQDQPVQSWSQALANVLNHLVGGWQEHDYEAQRKANDEYSQNQISRIIGQSVNQAAYPTNALGASGHATMPGASSPVAAALVQPGPTVGDLAKQSIADSLINKMEGVESGGDNTAANPRSSALGPLQFTSGTWGSLMRQHPDLGLTADGRTDPAQAEAAGKQLASDNIAYMLAHNVQNPTEAQTYLAHFAGAPAATRLIQADPNTPVSQIMTPGQIAANPFLQGMTAQNVQDWAAQKMGAPAQAPSAAVPQQAQAMPSMGQYAAIQPQPAMDMSSLLSVLTDPRANQQLKAVAGAAYQNALQQNLMTQQEILRQSDPLYMAEINERNAMAQRYNALANAGAQPPQQFRLLSADEKQQMGLPPGGNFQVGPDGKVSAVGGGGVNVLPNAPAGYYYQPGTDGQASLQPIPGGPVDQAKNKQADQAQTASDVIGRTGHDLIGTIDQSPGSTTGVGGVALSYLPTSQAAQVRRLDSVLSAMGSIEAVSAMRQASPTGGALGSLTEKEEALLKSKQGALDPRAGYDTYRKNALDYIHTVYRLVNGGDAGDRLYGQFLDGLGGALGGGPRTTSSGVTWSVK